MGNKDRSNLVATPVVDKNGVLTTRFKKPISSSSNKGPLPAVSVWSTVVSPEEEQQALHDALIDELSSIDPYGSRRIRINNLQQRSDQDYRPLFKSFLAAIRAEQGLNFVEAVHDILLRHGNAEPHLIINEEALAITDAIVKATGNYQVPLPKANDHWRVSKYINYALTSQNDNVDVLQILKTHSPETLEQFQELCAEFSRSTRPLQGGVL